jgi:hypothetical protein
VLFPLKRFFCHSAWQAQIAMDGDSSSFQSQIINQYMKECCNSGNYGAPSFKACGYVSFSLSVAEILFSNHSELGF